MCYVIRAGIKKKILRVGKKPESIPAQSKENEDYDKITEIKYTEKEVVPFKSSIQIYDSKISYQIIDGENLVSILIEDKNIFQPHKTVFELLWEK